MINDGELTLLLWQAHGVALLAATFAEEGMVPTGPIFNAGNLRVDAMRFAAAARELEKRPGEQRAAAAAEIRVAGARPQ